MRDQFERGGRETIQNIPARSSGFGIQDQVSVTNKRAANRRTFLRVLGGTLVASVVPLSVYPDVLAATEIAHTVFIYDPRYKRHDTGPQHPERPERMDAILAWLERVELAGRLPSVAPRPATQQELSACYGQAYIDLVRCEVMAGDRQLSTGDTVISPASLDVAVLAAGGALAAVDAVVEGRAQNAFCAIRPPGHHASSAWGMGFYIFNNVALAARYAQQTHSIGKVAIVDWDVHHGNGTQNIFYEDPSVFFFSTHQSPWYPYTGPADETGQGAGLGTTMNFPFAAGAGRPQIVGAMQDKLLPALQQFKPELILISAGFDSKLGDPLGRFELTDPDFVDMTRLVMTIAREHCQNRVVSILEGGYSLEGLASAVAAHIRTLAGEEAPLRGQS